MKNDIAIQLYSLRDISNNDYMQALQIVSRLGFQNVEFAGYYGLDAVQMKETLDSLGLKTVSAHVGGKLSPEQISDHIRFNKAVGNNTLVCPYLPFGDLEATLQDLKYLKMMQKLCEDAGMLFGYHNHAHEMVKVDGDKRIIDILAEEGILLQPDVFWVKTGGYDPVEFINRNAGNIVSLHFKEYGADGSNVELGNGIFDWAAIDAAGKKAGARYNILEQEEYTMDVADSIAECAKNLNRLFK